MDITAIISGVSVVAGAVLNEALRRRNRRELYLPQLFEKRLAAYEMLLEILYDANDIATEAIENDTLTKEQRHELVSSAIHSVAQFTDKNRLYLDEELTVHCIAMFMGVEDIHDATEDKENLLSHYRQMWKEAIRMIMEDSGVAEVNKLFKSINKPKIDGDIIRYLRAAKKKAKKKSPRRI